MNNMLLWMSSSSYGKPNIGLVEVLIGVALAAIVFGALAWFTRDVDKKP